MSREDIRQILEACRKQTGPYEPDTSEIAEDECCVCGSYKVSVVAPFGYPFCGGHSHRAMLIQGGYDYHWPALHIEGITGTYALEGDQEAWLFNAFCATDERIVELLDALEEYKERFPQAS